MKSLNILIVEDEILIAETIKLYLQEANHKVCTICISYDEAITAFHLHSPDLVLLDIRLFGEKSGIDVANYLKSIEPKSLYIFLTSQHDKRILDLALKTIPYGYIAKPLQKETLWTSIEAAYQLFTFHYKEPEKIEISDGKENYKLNVNEILYIQADHVYSHIFLEKDKKLIIRKAIQYLHDLLSPTLFVRCHRSFIINTEFVKKWNREVVEMSNGTIIPISKSYKEITNNKLKD
ncbi:MAG: response regulator transcription factor [Saprospiraceae bacterium]|nr:response regulator transcription factor [Candidatus Vicinibacter proximus]